MVVIGGQIPGVIELDSELVKHPIPNRTDEAHRKQGQINFHSEFGAWNRLELRRRSNENSVQLRNPAVTRPGKLRCSKAPVANATFFVSRLGTQLHRPERPGSLWRALLRRLRHDFELVDRQRLLPMAGPEAIGAGVAASDDHYPLPGRENLGAWCNAVTQTAADLLRPEHPCRKDTPLFSSPELLMPLLLPPPPPPTHAPLPSPSLCPNN